MFADSFSPLLPRSSPSLKTKLGMAFLNLSLLLAAPGLVATPALSAEKVYFSYGILDFSLSIDSLETYAREGKINPDFNTYASYLSEAQLEQLRQVLLAQVDLSPVAVSQFLYSPQGEIILGRLGEVIQTQNRRSSFYALRAALILAAADPQEGLTPLNVLRKFPLAGIRINSQSSFQLLDELTSAIQETEKALTLIERESRREALNSSLPPGTPSDLRQSGNVNFRVDRLDLYDESRDRAFPVDLYLPQAEGRSKLVVISHGLGSDLSSFSYLANHLASYGFAVAVLEHPGSNAQQIDALLTGLENVVTPPQELINRPLDVTYLLDVLEARYSDRLDVEKVGVFGQSFGGYTVLALAGASFNLEKLQSNCDSSEDLLNLSLLIQCQALQLNSERVNFRDERVAAAIAVNPLASQIFGREGVQEISLPVMIIGGSSDTVTPVLQEQIRPFTWLETNSKYLALFKEGTHFSTIGGRGDAFPLPERVIGPDPQVAQNYAKALSLAFFSTYIAEIAEFGPFLDSRYAQYLSQQVMPLVMVRSLSEEQ